MTAPKRVLVPRDTSGTDEAVRRKIIAVPGQEKKLRVQQIPNTGLYEIRYAGGGPTPGPLQGSYTSSGAAEKAIDRWLR